MTETTAEKKHITIGILAHVDAGKTTLSEELLYETGVRKHAISRKKRNINRLKTATYEKFKF